MPVFVFCAVDVTLLLGVTGFVAEAAVEGFRAGVLEVDGPTDGRFRRGESVELVCEEVPAVFEADEGTRRDDVDAEGLAAVGLEELGSAALLPVTMILSRHCISPVMLNGILTADSRQRSCE